MTTSCEHLDAAAAEPRIGTAAEPRIGTAAEPQPGTPDGCAECLALGEHVWAHLRICLACGHVGCCDSSPHRHATAHFHETGHPVIRSFEPGETWRWCYVDERMG